MEVYFDPAESGSFGGVAGLAKRTNRKSATHWLAAQDAYTLHKPVIRKYPRRKTFTVGIDDLWQADLVDVSSIAYHNGGMRFLLTAIDTFSKYAWAIPLKNKKADTVRDAFASLITLRKPKLLQTDKGTE